MPVFRSIGGRGFVALPAGDVKIAHAELKKKKKLDRF